MKNILFIIFCCLTTISFSQNNFSVGSLGELKDVNGIMLNNDLFLEKYTLIYNLTDESKITLSIPYFKEVSSIYKNAFFNSVENKGLTVLIFLHSNTINHNEYSVLDNMIIIPVNTKHNLEILNSNVELLSAESILINSFGKLVATDFNASDLRISLTKYLKRI